jgi:hypothetical protein
MDGFDIVAIATLGQTIVLTVTLIVFILQLRSQTKAIKDAAYQSVLDDYNDIIRTQIHRPEIGELLDDLVRPGLTSASELPPLSSREKLVRSYLLMIYGLFERVYILHDKEWIDEGSWREWATWIEVMARNPIFTHVHTISRGMFNAAFQDYVSGLIAPSSRTNERRTRGPETSR